jgi:hypothetical protein
MIHDQFPYRAIKLVSWEAEHGNRAALHKATVKFITVILSTAVEVPKKQSFNRKQPETEKPRNTAQHNRARCPPKKQRTSTRANSVFRQLKLSSQ